MVQAIFISVLTILPSLAGVGMSSLKSSASHQPFQVFYYPALLAINNALKAAGGKPKECVLDDYSKGGNGKAAPEYIITLILKNTSHLSISLYIFHFIPKNLSIYKMINVFLS